MVVAARHGSVFNRSAQGPEIRAEGQRRPARDAQRFATWHAAAADAAHELRPLADGLLAAPELRIAHAVPDDPRRVAYARPRARRPGRQPSGGVLDSQTVKALYAKARGRNTNKRTFVRKRHIAVDTDGRLLMVNLTTADLRQRRGAGDPQRRAQA